jgi:hypothetical protein
MIVFVKMLATLAAFIVLATIAFAESGEAPAPKPQQAAAEASNASPIYGVTLPRGYRDWKVISVSQINGKLNQLRVEVGNDIAIKAFREGTLPFPDGAIIAALHWTAESPESNNQVLAALDIQSLTAGTPANAQFMVKDSKRYPASAGWGFADFKDGKPQNEALHEACFGCHEPAKAQDYIYTHYARTPGN